MTTTEQRENVFAKDFLAFLNASPCNFYAVKNSAEVLERAGFTKLSEADDWKIEPNGRYFFTRNQSSLFAFAVGGKWKPGQGFTIVGAHTESPCPKVKPCSKKTSSGFVQVGVELYGGGLWNTWFDRDLSVAGRVIVEEEGKFVSRLVRIRRPILHIPNLAIHLNRSIRTDGFKPNRETHVLPVLATEVKRKLLEKPSEEEEKLKPSVADMQSRHHPLLLRLVAEELKVPVSALRDFELCLYDTQDATVGGALNEFVFSGRLDNLCMSFCSLRAMVESLDSLDTDPNVRVLALFDNEEVGSSTYRGANSNLMPELMRRLSGDSYSQALRRSIVVSADMAHAVHPNYAAKHEENHRPRLNGGLVIKQNTNQRYATTNVGAFFVREIAAAHKLEIQDFVVRNDSVCGSTIGPMLSARCGVRTVDVGVPQLSMHSIRETCATADVMNAVELLAHFYKEFPVLDAKLTVD